MWVSIVEIHFDITSIFGVGLGVVCKKPYILLV